MLRVPLRKLATAILVVLLCAAFASPLQASPATGTDPSFEWQDWLQSLAHGVARAFDRAEGPAPDKPVADAPQPAPNQSSFEDADFVGSETENLPTVDPDG
jgi:hypothetical protein